MQPPHGPFKIRSTRQITLPAELLKQINIETGDFVYVSKAEDIEGALLVIPLERIVSWIEAGRLQDALPAPIEDLDGY